MLSLEIIVGMGLLYGFFVYAMLMARQANNDGLPKLKVGRIAEGTLST